MAKNWKLIKKVPEECAELTVEVMKLMAFPSGKHPGRKRNVVLSVEDEVADVLAVLNYFVDRNNLDRTRIEKRVKYKTAKFVKWEGDPKTKNRHSQVKTNKTTGARRKTTKNAPKDAPGDKKSRLKSLH